VRSHTKSSLHAFSAELPRIDKEARVPQQPVNPGVGWDTTGPANLLGEVTHQHSTTTVISRQPPHRQQQAHPHYALCLQKTASKQSVCAAGKDTAEHATGYIYTAYTVGAATVGCERSTQPSNGILVGNATLLLCGQDVYVQQSPS
jgi:hypothetical protein